MPKKKIQHKGKPKHAVEENEDFEFRRNESGSIEKDVDFEENKKYNKRPIQNNWSKYEDRLSNFDWEDAGEELPKTDDFNYLIKTASSDYSHFQLSSEKLWSSENSIPASKIFNLDLNILATGLACIPFYERMRLNKNELSVEDKKRFDKEAENSWKNYNLIMEKSGRKMEDDPKLKSVDGNAKTVENSLQKKLKLSESNQDNTKTDVNPENAELPNLCKNLEKIEILEKESSGIKREGNKQNIFFSENDENLEDWLNNMLDD